MTDKIATDKKISEVKSDVIADKSDADYKIAIEKCGSLFGPAKVACTEEAKSKYSK